MVTKHIQTLLEVKKLKSNQNQIQIASDMQYGHFCISYSGTHFEPCYLEISLLDFAQTLHLIQDNMNVNNFAKRHHPKFLLYFKWQASKVETLRHMLDHMPFCDFANQLQIDPNHHHSSANVISLHSTKIH
jgi:hypothetical protein